MSVLLIAHGSPDPRHSAAIESFAEQVQAASGLPTTVGYLDHNNPRVEAALRTVSAEAAGAATEPVKAVGLFLSAGYHVQVDVPAVLADAGAAVTDCGPLGLGDWLLPALDRAATQASPDDAQRQGVALVATGSSRDEAREEILDLAARWEQHRGAPVRAAFATGPGKSLDEALSMLGETDCDGRVVMPLLLAPGSMADRVIEHADRAGMPVSAPLLSRNPAPPELLSRVLHLLSAPR